LHDLWQRFRRLLCNILGTITSDIDRIRVVQADRMDFTVSKSV
jgi:hypothetical protein